MQRAPHNDYDQAAAADRLLFRYSDRLTAGAIAFHQLDPAEHAMLIEEFDPHQYVEKERSGLRSEIFSGFVEYLFADGPAPGEVLLRLEGFFHSFYPPLAEKITGPREWITEAAAAAVIGKYHAKLARVRGDARGRGALSTWSRQLDLEPDFEFVRKTLVGLVKLMASEGLERRNLVAVAYCIAKALRPQLLAGMSLHDIAILSGDKGGRATPCDRGKRVFNRRVAAAGMKGCSVHYQKSAETVKKYSEAQKGNNNRSKNHKSKKKTARKTKP
jgi:hypothetical protein